MLPSYPAASHGVMWVKLNEHIYDPIAGSGTEDQWHLTFKGQIANERHDLESYIFVHKLRKA